MRSRLPVLLFIVLLAAGGIWYFTRDTRTREERAEEYFQQARALAGREEYEQAITSMKKSIKYASDRIPERYYLVGCYYLDSGQPEKAIREFEEAMRRGPQEGYIRVVYAWCFLETVQDKNEAWKRVNKELNKLTKEQRRDPRVSYNLACLYATNDRPELALRHIAHAIKTDPFLKGQARKDEDFASIRHTEQFKRLVQ